MLNEFLTSGVFAFMLTFVRIGSALTVMPGIGDSYTPANVRLYIALGLSLVLAPFVAPSMPAHVPTTGPLVVLIGSEMVVGLFFGTITRVLMSALDTAGMLISVQSSLGSAQLFNPALATQGSLIGTMLTILGVLVLFSTDLDHMLFYGLIGSYHIFPVGTIPDPGGMASMMARVVGEAFMVGVEISSPFIIVTMLIYIGMGVMTRLMPQMQVFTLAMPIQILVSLLTLVLTISASMLFWLNHFQDVMMYFFRQGS
jgi:flagellar biosynthetic protein FliR